MLTPILIVSLCAIAISCLNAVQIWRNSEQSFRRKVMRHIDREISAIEMREASGERFDAISEAISKHNKRLNSLQGQITQIKDNSTSKSKEKKYSFDKENALADLFKTSEIKPDAENPREVPHYLNYV